MHLEAHAGVGWLLAQAAHAVRPGAPGVPAASAGGEAGRPGRRLRGAVLLAAVLPDLDAASRLFGIEAYVRHHHVLAHNVLFSLAVSAAAAWLCRGKRLRAILFTQLAFYTHFFGDYFFTVYALKPFYPFSDAEFLFEHAVYLGHPVNTALAYAGLATFLVAAAIWKRTPVEVLSPALDERLVNMFFRRRTLACSVCGGKANERCASCGEPVCRRHGHVGWRFTVTCSRCRSAGGPATKGTGMHRMGQDCGA